jgi:glycerol-3-phosphate dehydrogenase
VGLIERGDFGGSTSQNSLKVIHGGLRYLRDGSLRRVRMMARERTTWMRIAPHLVHPLAFVIPTSADLARGKLAMRFAFGLNDLVSYDRNRLPDPEKFLPGGRIISLEECARLLPGLGQYGMTGAAMWYDAQMHSSERLLLEFVHSAEEAGAAVANYVEATSLLRQGKCVIGVRVRDVLSEREFDLRSSMVINAAGAWIDHLLGTLEPAVRPQYSASIAVNLMVRQVWEGIAVGLPSKSARSSDFGGQNRLPRMIFVVPWRDRSILGTWHIPWPHPPDEFQMTDPLIQGFLDEANRAYPGLDLSLEDVEHAHWGFLPVESSGGQEGGVKLQREGVVVNHQKTDGVAGLISVVGVKYTTARLVAEKAMDLAVDQLGRKGLACQTHCTAVMGGHIDRFQAYLAEARAQTTAGLDAAITEHLVYSYGSQHHRLLESIAAQPALGERVDGQMPVTRAEIVHAVRQEMAQTLSDVIRRRTELGAGGLPSMETLRCCAELAGRELGWDSTRQSAEIELVLGEFPLARAGRAA